MICIFTFRVRHSRLSLAAFPHYCTDWDVSWGIQGVPSSCALLGRFAIGARVSLLWQHSAEREMSASACTRSMPGLSCDRELWHMILTINLNLDGINTIPIQYKTSLYCAARGKSKGKLPCQVPRSASFCSTVIVRTQTHTQPTDCSAWTTKFVSN